MAIFSSAVGVSNSFQDSRNAIHLPVPIINKIALSVANVNNTFLDHKQSNHIKTAVTPKNHYGGIGLPISTTSSAVVPIVPQRRVLGVLFFRPKK